MQRAHRSVDDILHDMAACDEAVARAQDSKRALQRELAQHPALIEQQLVLCDVPAQVRARHHIEELYVSYDPCVSEESVGADCGMVQLQEYTISVTIDGRRHPFCASRWTGQAWDCYGFYRLDGEQYSELCGDALWDAVMRENDTTALPVAASIATLIFCDIEFGDGAEALLAKYQ